MFPRVKFLSVLLAAVALVAVGCTPNPTPVPATVTVAPPTATTAPATSEPPTPTTEPATAVPPTVAPTDTPSSPIATPESPLATPTAAASGSDTTDGGLPDIIVNAQMKQMQAGAFRAVMKIDVGAGTTVENTIEYQLPDRIHMITPAGEFIAIRNQGTWQKSGATWAKSQLDLGASIFNNLDPKALDDLRKSLDVKQGAVKDMGTQTLNGKPAHAYQYESSVNTGGVPMNSTTTLWIDPVTNLPIQSDIVADAVVEGGAQTKMTITYTYDPNIKIEAPE